MLKSGRLSKPERIALERFADGDRECPPGVGQRTIRNLQGPQRRWIVWGRDYEGGPEVFTLTAAGKAALEADRALDDEISN